MAEAREIKTTLALDGEKAFKAAMDEMYRGMKILGSEMKLNTAIFGDNASSMEGLTKKGEILRKEIEQQRVIVEALARAVEESAAAYGETDKKTDAYRIKLNNAQAALANMERELDANEQALQGVGKETEDAEKKTSKWGETLKKVGETLGKGFATAAKAAAVAIGTVAVAAGAAAVKLGKEVVGSYADYEQLVGGVDTLFKESSKTVQAYAANAFKTAGLSANDYMETVTGFSASLIQSVGGDTAKAAKLADQAITDMADNANKMGTDLSSLQNAYQGFAKGQYNMLDNLKLGYGGTKEEMQRLLSDAEKIAGVKFDISSFADITEAIHVMQVQMGIAGTTAKEAADTISGSISGTKSAIQNLITGLGTSGADISMLVKNVIESAGNVVKNIQPVIENLISAIPVAATEIAVALNAMLPSLLESVVTLFSAALNMLVSLLPSLVPVATDAIMTITNALLANLPSIVAVAGQLIVGLADGLLQSLPSILEAGMAAVSELVRGIGNALPALVPAAIAAVMALLTTFYENMPEIIKSGLEMIVNLVKGIVDAIPKIIEALPKLIQAMITYLTTSLPEIIKAGIEITIALIAGIIKAIPQLIAAMPEIIIGIVNGLIAGISSILDVGVQLVKGLWEGIKSATTWLWNKIKGWISDALGWIANLLGIHSPSRKMRDMIGKPMVQGMAEGITKNAKLVDRALGELVPDTGVMLDITRRFNDVSGSAVANRSGSQSTVRLEESALDRLAGKIAKAIEKSDTVIIMDDREFGRAVRKVALA